MNTTFLARILPPSASRTTNKLSRKICFGIGAIRRIFLTKRKQYPPRNGDGNYFGRADVTSFPKRPPRRVNSKWILVNQTLGSSRSNAGVSGPPRRLNFFCDQANLVGFTAARSPVCRSADPCAAAQTLDPAGATQE